MASASAPRIDTPRSHGVPSLRYFTQHSILEQIGAQRLLKFMAAFADDLTAARIPFPGPDTPLHRNFPELIELFSCPALPERFRNELLTLETAAAPQNQSRLDDALRQYIGHYGLNAACPLDCALELWFTAPESLIRFRSSNGKDVFHHVPDPAPSALTMKLPAGAEKTASSPHPSPPVEERENIPEIFAGYGAQCA